MIDYETPRRAFLQYIVFVLFKRKWLMLWGFLAMFLSVFLAVELTYPAYLGITKIWVNRSAPNQDVGFFPDVQRPGISVGLFSPAYNWIEVINGQSMAMEVVKEFHLDEFFRQRAQDPQGFRENFWYYAKTILLFPKRIPAMLGLLPATPKDFFAYATAKVKDEMVIADMANQTSDVMAISVYAPTARLAQDIPNFIAQRLIERVIQGEQNKARFAIDFANTHLADVSSKLNTAESTLIDYQKKREIIDLGKQKDNMVTRSDAVATILQESRRSFETAKTKLEVLNQQIENQKKAFVSSAVLQKDISDRQGLVQDIDTAQESIRVLEQQVVSLRKRALELTEAEFVNTKLSREIDIYSKMWSQFQDKLAKLHIETISRLKEISMEVVDPALVPESTGPIWPENLTIYIVGAVLAIFSGLALAFIFEYYNDSLRSPVEIEKELNIPALSSIPEFRFQNKR